MLPSLSSSQISRRVSLGATVGLSSGFASTLATAESRRSRYSSSENSMLSARLCTTSSIWWLWLSIRAVL